MIKKCFLMILFLYILSIINNSVKTFFIITTAYAVSGLYVQIQPALQGVKHA